MIIRVPDLPKQEEKVLCFTQCVDRRAPMVRCNLLKNHTGKHSWEK
jgi:hypothetical protein